MIIDRVKTVSAGLSLMVLVACGSVEEAAETEAVRDRSRVLGLADMGDGTYQFRLCRPHKSYTAAVLEKDCINPFVDREGMPKVFSSVPERPSTATAHVRNLILVSIGAPVLAGALIYKPGRFIYKSKASSRMTGKIRVKKLEARLDKASVGNDLNLIEELKRASNNEEIGEILLSGDEGKRYSTLFDFDTGYRQPLIESLQNVSSWLNKEQNFYDLANSLENSNKLTDLENRLSSLIGKFGKEGKEIEFVGSLGQVGKEIENIVASIKELGKTKGTEFSAKLQKVTKDLEDVTDRLQNTDGIRLSDKVREDLIEKEKAWS